MTEEKDFTDSVLWIRNSTETGNNDCQQSRDFQAPEDKINGIDRWIRVEEASAQHTHKGRPQVEFWRDFKLKSVRTENRRDDRTRYYLKEGVLRANWIFYPYIQPVQKLQHWFPC